MQMVKATSIADYIDKVESLRNQAKVPLWFRGVKNISHDLVPSLYRHTAVNDTASAALMESRLANVFKQRSIPYLTTRVQTDLEMMFLMQHHSFPTRLLDWTENPMAALSFATTGAPRQNKPKIAAKTSAVVWVLDPTKWNRNSLAATGFTGGILDIASAELKPYLGALNSNEMPLGSVCLHGAYNSARIVAQRGVFVIFGKGLTAMEKIASSSSRPSGLLAAINIHASKVIPMSERLVEYGFGDATLFPELDGLAREVRASLRF